MESAPAAEVLNRRYFLLLILINASIPISVLINERSTGLSRGLMIMVGWVSAVLVNLVFAFAFRQLRTGQMTSSGRLAGFTIAFIITSGLLSTISVTAFGQETNYLKLAQSNTPLDEIRPERTRVLVEFLRRRTANSANYSKQAVEMKPISPGLYSAESFSNKQAVVSVPGQFQTAYRMDVAYADLLNQTNKDFQNEMMKVDPAYIQSLDASLHDSDALESQIISDEGKWADCTTGIYSYAAAHAGKITLGKSGKLEIPDEVVRDSFVKQLSSCKALQQQVMDEQSKAAQLRQKASDNLR